jgi:hypothetical protein
MSRKNMSFEKNFYSFLPQTPISVAAYFTLEITFFQQKMGKSLSCRLQLPCWTAFPPFSYMIYTQYSQEIVPLQPSHPLFSPKYAKSPNVSALIEQPECYSP